jgi:hypothetical protein
VTTLTSEMRTVDRLVAFERSLMTCGGVGANVLMRFDDTLEADVENAQGVAKCMAEALTLTVRGLPANGDTRSSLIRVISELDIVTILKNELKTDSGRAGMGLMDSED